MANLLENVTFKQPGQQEQQAAGGVDLLQNVSFVEPQGLLGQTPTDERSIVLQISDLRTRQAQGEEGLQDQIQELMSQLSPETVQSIPGLAPETKSLTGARPIEFEEPVRSSFPKAELPGGIPFPFTPGDFAEAIPAGKAAFKQGISNIQLAAVRAKEGLFGDEESQRDLEMFRNVRRRQTDIATEGSPLSAFAGEVAGEAIALPVPGVGPAAGPLKTIATQSLTGLGTATVSAFGRGDDVIDSALTGLGFGAGLGSLTQGGLAIARKISNARGGKFASDDIDELIRLGKEEGIPVFVDDVADSAITREIGTLAEKVPVTGTFAGRRAQNVAQREAAERFQKNLGGDISDVAGVAQKGLQDKLTRLKKIVSKKFDKVAAKLNPLGGLPKTNFNQQIEQELAEELAKGTRAKPEIVEILESFRDAPQGNFSVIRGQRSDLGDEIARFYQGDNAVIGSKGVDRLQRVKNALEDDIEAFTQQSPEGLKEFRRANKFTQEKLIPFKKSQLARLVKTEEPESVIAFLKSFKGQGGRGSRAQNIFNAMTTEGKRAVRTSLVDEAFRQATKTPGAFSPAKFASELKNLENVTSIFFKGQQKKQLDGLVKLMQVTQRAGQVLENPPTGLRLLVPGVAISIGPGGAGAIGGFGLAAKALLQSEAGRAALLGLNRTTPGTAAFERFVSRANNLLIRAANVGAQDNG